jgi:prepilin-type N-terminal cleavage/methylation domain-containing protein
MKKAFTLAEVLITLGIIGVVAALTMPSLIANYKKRETVKRLKKAYSVLNQAMKLSEVENGDYEYWEDSRQLGAQNYLNKYWAPYIKGIKTCTTYKQCGYKSSQPFIFSNGGHSNLDVILTSHRLPIITGDGMMYIIGANTGSALPFNVMAVDINFYKPPNQYGKDLFIFMRVTGKGILPYGYDFTDADINNFCKKTTGTAYSTCAAKIMRDGWEIKDDYPW